MVKAFQLREPQFLHVLGVITESAAGQGRAEAEGLLLWVWPLPQLALPQACRPMGIGHPESSRSSRSMGTFQRGGRRLSLEPGIGPDHLPLQDAGRSAWKQVGMRNTRPRVKKAICSSPCPEHIASSWLAPYLWLLFCSKILSSWRTGICDGFHHLYEPRLVYQDLVHVRCLIIIC